MNDPELDEQLEKIAELLELAREIVAELESGETVETTADAIASIVETHGLALRLAKECIK